MARALHTRSSLGTVAWWAALAVIALAGTIGRAWNLDFDARQHQHPDERHWALTSAALQAEHDDPARAPSGHGTVFGPVLDWLDADVSPANPYRVQETFVYGPAPLAWARGVAAWLADGVATGAQPADAIVSTLDAVGVPLLATDGTARFDAGYHADLIGRLLGVAADAVTIVLVGCLGRRLGGRRTGGPAAGLVGAALYAACPLMLQATHFWSSEPTLALACAATLLAALGLDRGASVRAAVTGGSRVGALAGAAVAVKLSAVPLVAVPVAGLGLLAWRHRRGADVARLVSAVVALAAAFRVLHPGAFDGAGLTLSARYRADLRWSREQFTIDWPPAYQWAGRRDLAHVLEGLLRFTLGPGLVLAAVAGAVVLGRRSRRRWADRWTVVVTIGAVVAPIVYVVGLAVPIGRYFVPIVPAVAALAGLGVVGAFRAARQVGVAWAAHAVRLAGAAPVMVGVLWGVMFVHGVYAAPYTRAEASEWISTNVPPGSVLTVEAWDDALPLALPGVDPGSYTHEQLDLVGTDSAGKVVRLVEQLGRVDYVVESSPRLWGVVGRLPARFPSTIRFFEGLDSGALGFERAATFDRDPGIGPLRLDDGGAEEAFSVYDHPEVRIWRKVAVVPPRRMLESLDPVAAANALTVTSASAGADGLRLTGTELAELGATGSWDARFTGGPTWAHALGWFVVFELLAAAAFVHLHPLTRRLPDAGWGVAKPLGLAAPAVVLFVLGGWFDVPISRPVVAAVVAATVAGAAWRCRRPERREALARTLRARRRVMSAVELLSSLALAAMLALRAAGPDLWHPWRGGEKPFELAVLSALLRGPGIPPYDPWFAGGSLNYYYGGFLQLLAPARLLGTSPAVTFNVGIAVFAGCAASAAAGLGAWLAGRRRAVAGAVAGVSVLVVTNVAVVGEVWRRWRTGRPFDWWPVSRVVPGTTDITEFPAWTFLFGDLHPHLMATGLVLTVPVVVVVVHDALVADARAGWAAALLAGLLAGLVRATNTWDFPFALAAPLAGVAWVAARTPALRRRAAVAAVAVLVGSFVVWRPYAARGQVFDGGVERATLHTPLHSWLTQFGWFAAATVLVLAAPVAAAVRHGGATVRARLTGALCVVGGLLLLRPGATVFVVTAVAAGAAGWRAWRLRTRRAAVAVGLIAVGWALQAGVEMLTIRNDIGRQNTVFKFWYESWLLLGAGVAAELLRLSTGRLRTAARSWTVAVGAVAVAFWVLAVPARVDDRVSAGGWTLDGERYLVPPVVAGATPVASTYRGVTFDPAADRDLVGFLRAHVPGGRVVAEAAGDDYAWTGRTTWLTGLPVPSGWRFHSEQQRRAYADAVNQRYADLQTLFATTDAGEVSRILATYRVDLVVFGSVERILADEVPGAADALRRHPCLTTVFTAGDGWVAAADSACATAQWLDRLAAEVDPAAGR